MPMWAWAILIKPLATLLIFAGIVIPIELLVQRKMKDGKLKRLLLRRIS